MTQPSPDTSTDRELLRGAQLGDVTAIDQLLARHLDWLRRAVRRRLGPVLRELEGSEDILQSTLREFIAYAPPVPPSTEAQFRALLAQILENKLRQKHTYHHRARRDCRREADDGNGLAALTDSITSPGTAAERAEALDHVRLAIELLDPIDHQIVERRMQGAESSVIAGEVGMSLAAVEKRYQRALRKLSRLVGLIQHGRLEDLLQQEP